MFLDNVCLWLFPPSLKVIFFEATASLTEGAVGLDEAMVRAYILNQEAGGERYGQMKLDI